MLSVELLAKVKARELGLNFERVLRLLQSDTSIKVGVKMKVKFLKTNYVCSKFFIFVFTSSKTNLCHL